MFVIHLRKRIHWFIIIIQLITKYRFRLVVMFLFYILDNYYLKRFFFSSFEYLSPHRIASSSVATTSEVHMTIMLISLIIGKV